MSNIYDDLTTEELKFRYDTHQLYLSNEELIELLFESVITLDRIYKEDTNELQDRLDDLENEYDILEDDYAKLEAKLETASHNARYYSDLCYKMEQELAEYGKGVL